MCFSTRLFFSILININFACAASFVQAKSVKCEAIFAPTVVEIIQKLDRENNQFLLNGQDVHEYSKDFSWLRKRKLRKLILSYDIKSIRSESSLNRYVVDLGAVLFGPESNLISIFKNSKDERLEKATTKIIQEKILNDGLLRAWNESRDGSSAKLASKVLDKVSAILNSRLLQLIGFPLTLPEIRNEKISNELMYKIIRDGYREHAEEARLELRQQNNIDAYNAFRKAYQPTVMAILLVAMAHTGYENYNKMIQDQVDSAVVQFQEARSSLNESVIIELKTEIYRSAVDEAIKDFIVKWKDEPTPEEIKLIEEKISSGLKLTPAPQH